MEEIESRGNFMKFHGLMIVRNEADIIEECLSSLLKWINAVYVLDLGSSDSTWHIVKRMAMTEKRIVPFEQRPFAFSNALRGYIFEKYRDKFCPGDWILRVDADEFYEIAPPDFVRNFLHPRETCVYLQWYYFRLTSLEVSKYQSGVLSIEEDRKRSILERRRHYKLPTYSEPRMFRYRETIKWNSHSSFPSLAGKIAQARIPIRHYPHRDPPQMQQRYSLRFETYSEAAEKGDLPHWDTANWLTDVLSYDERTNTWKEGGAGTHGLASAPDHTSGELLEWRPGSALPLIEEKNHLPTGRRRFAQNIIYPHLAPLLDYCEPGWPKGYIPPLRAK